MALNRSSRVSNGFVTTPLRAQQQNGEFSLKFKPKCIYIGKVQSHFPSVVFKADRIMLNNITKGAGTTSKYNITVPFIEITAIRYCFDRDISLFVIQPIFESFQKLTAWIQMSPANRVPENFIMIHFESHLDDAQVGQIKTEARQTHPPIKICEINSAFAHTYLKTPNKVNVVKHLHSGSSIGVLEAEVIELEDDDDHHVEEVKKNLLNKVIIRYPPNEPNQISLYGKDLDCIRDGQYLNDNIVNFYLKHFQNHDSSAARNEDKIFIYDALFATHLTNNRKRRYHHQGAQLKNFLVYQVEPFTETYHRMLKKWTKDIDIFSKDYLLIPFVKESHWFLVILCNIGNLIPENNSKEKATFIYMDSLNQTISRQISQTIYKYLQMEFQEKRKSANQSIQQGPVLNHNYVELTPKVPQQQNYYDCGLFVLEYIERFLGDPDGTLKALQNDAIALKDWFEPKSLKTKRAKIKQIILNLMSPEEAVALERELEELNKKQFEESLSVNGNGLGGDLP